MQDAVARWKAAVVRAERRLVRFGCMLVAVDLVAAASGCFAPALGTLLSLGRLAGLIVFVPAVLRTLAIRHAERPDAEWLQSIAVAIGVAAAYFAVRTMLVVRACAL